MMHTQFPQIEIELTCAEETLSVFLRDYIYQNKISKKEKLANIGNYIFTNSCIDMGNDIYTKISPSVLISYKKVRDAGNLEDLIQKCLLEVISVAPEDN